MSAYAADSAAGLFQRVYRKGGLLDVRPKSSVIQRAVPFKESEKIGEAYVIGVAVSPPQNFTYTGTSPTPQNLVTSGASGVVIQAQVLPFATHGVEQVTLDTFSRAKTEAAFETATKSAVTGLQTATANRLEMDLLLGQWSKGIGEVASVSANGGNVDIVITDATWAPFLWSSLGEGFMFDSWTGTTKNNGSGVLAVVKGGINHATKTITASFTGTLGSEIAAGDILYPAGARVDGTTWNQPPGLMLQASAKTGTLININRALYSNMQGNSYDFAGPVSHTKIEDFVSALKDHGLSQDLTWWFAHKAWAKLNSDQARFRRTDSSFSETKFKNGVKSIEFTTSGGITISIEEHGFLGQGYSVAAPTASLMRPGSADITFGNKEMDDPVGGVFQPVPQTNYAVLPVFYDMGFADVAPAWSAVGTGITY